MRQIREMVLGDIPGVLGVEVEAFSVPWSEEAFLLELENPGALYLVAEEDGEILGYGGLHRVLDIGDITNIAVGENHRRQGLGGQILEQLILVALANGLSVLQLEVRVGNAPAIRLYEGYGFALVGRRPSYYTHPDEDALLYTLELKGMVGNA